MAGGKTRDANGRYFLDASLAGSFKDRVERALDSARGGAGARTVEWRDARLMSGLEHFLE